MGGLITNSSCKCITTNKVILGISQPMKNLLTLRVTKFRTDFQPLRETFRQTTQSNGTDHYIYNLKINYTVLFLVPLDSTEGKFNPLWTKFIFSSFFGT